MTSPTTSRAGGRDAVLVGAGIVGLATARYLQRDGWSVTLIDPAPPGEGGASCGNAGLIAAHIVRPLAMPGIVRQVPGMLLDPNGPLAIRWNHLPRLMPWLVRFLWSSRHGNVERLTAALADLLRHAFSAYEPLLETTAGPPLLKCDGVLAVYRDERALEAAGEELALVARHGVGYEIVGDNAIRELVPALAPGYRHGVLYPNSGHTLDPLRLARALADACIRDGGRLLPARTTGFEVEGDRVRAVVTDSGKVSGDLVVIAAGIWSRPLCRMLGLHVPMHAERGYHVTLPDPGVEVRVPFVLGDLRFAVTPMECGLRLAGTVELAKVEAPPDPRRHGAMIASAQRVMPGLRTEPRSSWMGPRPSLPDSLPVIGPSPRHANVQLAFGHAHIGMTAAAATGRAIADLASGRAPPFDTAPFDITRFAWRQIRARRNRESTPT